MSRDFRLTRMARRCFAVSRAWRPSRLRVGLVVLGRLCWELRLRSHLRAGARSRSRCCPWCSLPGLSAEHRMYTYLAGSRLDGLALRRGRVRFALACEHAIVRALGGARDRAWRSRCSRRLRGAGALRGWRAAPGQASARRTTSMSALLDDLRAVVGAAHVLAEGDLAAYERDWRRRYHGRCPSWSAFLSTEASRRSGRTASARKHAARARP